MTGISERFLNSLHALVNKYVHIEEEASHLISKVFCAKSRCDESANDVDGQGFF
jgi:hypothetical protein